METIEDKLVRDKIGSLEDLPAGYSPNLDSKWQLLDAALHPQRTRKQLVPMWVRVAATLAAVILLAYLFAPEKAQPTLEHAQSVRKEKVLPVVAVPVKSGERTAHKVNDVRPQESRGTLKANLSSEIEKKTIVIIQPAEMQSGASTDSATFSEKTMLRELATTSAPETKSRKPRYVEMEFSDPLHTISTARTSSGTNADFRVGIFTSNWSAPSETYTTVSNALFKVKL